MLELGKQWHIYYLCCYIVYWFPMWWPGIQIINQIFITTYLIQNLGLWICDSCELSELKCPKGAPRGQNWKNASCGWSGSRSLFQDHLNKQMQLKSTNSCEPPRYSEHEACALPEWISLLIVEFWVICFPTPSVTMDATAVDRNTCCWLSLNVCVSLEQLCFRRFLTLLKKKKISPHYCAKNTNSLVPRSCCAPSLQS